MFPGKSETKPTSVLGFRADDVWGGHTGLQDHSEHFGYIFPAMNCPHLSELNVFFSLTFTTQTTASCGYFFPLLPPPRRRVTPFTLRSSKHHPTLPSFHAGHCSSHSNCKAQRWLCGRLPTLPTTVLSFLVPDTCPARAVRQPPSAGPHLPCSHLEPALCNPCLQFLPLEPPDAPPSLPQYASYDSGAQREARLTHPSHVTASAPSFPSLST